jgi:hypothetical protein
VQTLLSWHSNRRAANAYNTKGGVRLRVIASVPARLGSHQNQRLVGGPLVIALLTERQQTPKAAISSARGSG